MSRPTEILMAEHRIIEQVLAALESFTRRKGERSMEDRAACARFAQFFRDYADGFHHGKEEELLFRELEGMGFPRNAGPLGVMLYEHVRGRELVGRLAALGAASAPWAEADSAELKDAALEYVFLLRNHIQKEDGVLFPMAEEALGSDLRSSLLARFRKFDEERSPEEKARLVQLADELVGTAAR